MSKTIQTTALAGCVALTLALVVFRAQADNPPAAEAPTVEQLLQRISELEDRVDQLEAQLDRRPVLHYTVPEPNSAAPNDVLRKYRQGEINGIPYHVIPIERGAEATSSTTLQLPQGVEGREPHRVERGQ